MSLILQRRKAASSHHFSLPDLMPLIDMVFILLIFFMLSSNFLKPVITLDLPSAKVEDKQKEKSPILISIDVSGDMYLNQEKIDAEQLHSRLLALIGVNNGSNGFEGTKILDNLNRPGKGLINSNDVDVVFSADKSVEYARFIQVIDTLKQLNIHNISLEHE